MPQPSRLHYVLLLSLPLSFPLTALADQDTNLRLNQSIEYRANRQERELLKDEIAGTTLVIDGQTYRVENNLDDLGRALYVSVQRQQWAAVTAFRARYVALSGHDRMLLAYADGALARSRGDLEQAEAHYRQLLTLQGDFLPGQLELARVLFENRKDRESAEAFRQISQSLGPADARNQGLGNTVDSFIEALDHRESWQGSLAIGPTWNDNLNQSSESTTHYRLETSDGVYLVERKMPKAVSAQGIDYEATLNKRVALSGHHGVFGRALAYGQAYDKESKYNEDTFIGNTGYSYQDGRNQYSLGPQFEYNRIGSDPMYSAWGLRGEWMHNLSATRMLKLEGEYKDMAYRRQAADTYDGSAASVYATLWQALPQQWVLFGGFDLTDRNTRDATEAYFQRGLRLGVAKDFGIGLSTVLFASWRTRQYDAYSALLDDRRHEEEQGYTFIVRAPGLAFHDLVPSLTFKYNKVNSNVDWLYSWERNSVSLKLEKQF
ncbi:MULTISPECIES: surface lipoprotein assembly modifier [unclassified Pseudomonas]|uniref:surface lipoprotein assembly modifier n=1 Tax=unclassified Pseudomonas TaxID=196821 RepID=UPI000760EA90|nr:MULTISPECIES: surface lipoprotein assembly modifier [unclassified Pseudomonas]